MALTAPQLTALKAAIDGDPTLSAIPNNSDSNFEVAALLNTASNPAWTVWRTNVERGEILENGFDWTRLDNLSVGKARVWNDIFVNGRINPSKTNVRSGIEAVWVGTAADLAVRAAIYVHCKMIATRAQKIFSTGSGSDASPAVMDANIGETLTLNYMDIDAARNLP